MSEERLLPGLVAAPQPVTRKIEEFLTEFEPYEVKNGAKLHLYFDEKSQAFYVTCHLEAKTLARRCDSEATLDSEDDDEIYKLNREITEDQAAYVAMERDALNGRSFEDIVLEFDTSYRPKKPLKVYGGQHRLRALTKAQDSRGSVLHGVRIYFGLTRDQKVEIATVNNTAIAVPNDLLDRMREQLLGSELRDWCQGVGLLSKGQDFADRRSHDVPTVRTVRTLLVNFYLGKNAAKVDDFHQPVLCKSGGIDEAYVEMRNTVDWADPKLAEMGQQFARLQVTT